MAIDLSINPQATLVVTRYADSVASSDLLEIYRTIYAHPELKPGFRELAILHHSVELEIDDAVMGEITALTKLYINNESAGSKAAIVMPHNADRSLATILRQFAEFTCRSRSQIFTCFDLHQATQWLEIDVDDVMP